MSRLSVPNLDSATGATAEAQLKKAIGKVPNTFAAIGANGAAVLKAVRETWLRVKKWLCDPYRPERHYMRGPGPKWREKHVHAGSIRLKPPPGRVGSVGCRAVAI